MKVPKPNSSYLEPLAMALRLEREGRKFFVDCAARFESKLARQTFEFLGAEEDKHIKRIEEYYNSIESSGDTELPPLEGVSTEERFRTFDSRLERLRDELRPTASDVEAYRYALKFENGAEQFYAKCMAETDDDNIRHFYEWLIHEESMHSRVLESCLRFAEDPTSFFKERDDKSE